MKAKKLIVGMAVFSFAALLLGGCGADNNNTASSSTSESTSQTSASDSASTESTEATVVAGEPMQDGTYRLEEKNYK
ncbi:FMN-binding protein, partial [Listeria monocytogenes]|nr:FMN-binding protein [Listeria monocytogenes]